MFCASATLRFVPFFFFFNDTATTEIYTLSLHDALPISVCPHRWPGRAPVPRAAACRDRKSTRLNSSHSQISYAVFCLKKKKKKTPTMRSKKQKRQRRTKRNEKTII